VDLREYWAREDTEFTPWLAEAQNLELLGETIGMDLELVETEVGVGPFRADVLCRADSIDSFVLIENQLEHTDHSHLGQILTYAAGLDADTIVWISPRFCDEHRAALDRLNEITGPEFLFFGVQVELWRIGDSIAAPRFSLVARPNDWTKRMRVPQRAGQSERAAMYKEFWTVLFESLATTHPDLELPPPSGGHWKKFAMADSRSIVSYAPSKEMASIYVLLSEDRPAGWAAHLSGSLARLIDKSGCQFEWVGESPDAGYFQLFLPLDHTDQASRDEVFPTIGEVLTCLQVFTEEEQKAFRAGSQIGS
jgi:hypothetical protein